MAHLKMVRAHGEKTLEDAKERIRRLLADMKSTLDKYVDRMEWNGPGTEAKLKGRHLDGTFAVNESNILVNLKLSLAARLVRSKIERRIDAALAKQVDQRS